MFVSALVLRLLPLRWGAYLSEFDSFYHYYIADYMVRTLPDLSAYQRLVDTKFWYPYGRQVGPTTPPGLPATAALLYVALSKLGISVSVLDVCIVFPPLMAALSTIAIFLLGREIADKRVGLLAAALLATNPAYISRTHLGFFKHESLGILQIIMILLFCTKALRADDKRHFVVYSLLCALMQTYLNITWGAFYYTLNLLSLTALAMVVIRKHHRKATLFIAIVLGTSCLLSTPVRRTANITFSLGTLPALIMMFVCIVLTVLYLLPESRPHFTAPVAVFAASAVIGAVVFSGAMPLPLAGKFVATLNPAIRSPLVASVAEHRTATWATLYHEFGYLLVFALFGMYMLAKKFREPDKMLLLLYGVTGSYFSATMARLSLVFTPGVCLIAAYGVAKLLDEFRKLIRKRRTHIEIPFIYIVIILLLLSIYAYRGVSSGYAPVTIAASSIPLGSGYRGQYMDWVEAVEWMRLNLGQTAVVLSWWDYGYWISVAGNCTSLADNSTVNQTQIALIGKFFLSNETEALRIARMFNVTHVLVFTCLPVRMGYGEEGKWRWMARIAGLNESALVEDELRNYGIDVPRGDTVLGSMLLMDTQWSRYAKELKYFKLVFKSSNGLVRIFEVVYPEEM